jgi:alkylhydroperoxidase/carboxymuconolactone decarboxylase family protein YurZ
VINQTLPSTTNAQKAMHRAPQQAGASSFWYAAFEIVEAWDPLWAKSCALMAADPWKNGILPRMTIELVCVAINAACTNLQTEGTRRHIRAALEAGATRDQLLMVIKMTSLLAIHSCSLGAPILLEEARAAKITLERDLVRDETPVCDHLRASGQWNDAWTPFYELDPNWTEQFIATGIPVYTGDVLEPKLAELLSIALDASFTHMYAPGTRRHIKAAIEYGATMQEIMEVLKLCVIQGLEAVNMAIPILQEELERASEGPANV